MPLAPSTSQAPSRSQDWRSRVLGQETHKTHRVTGTGSSELTHRDTYLLDSGVYFNVDEEGGGKSPLESALRSRTRTYSRARAPPLHPPSLPPPSTTLPDLPGSSELPRSPRNGSDRDGCDTNANTELSEELDRCRDTIVRLEVICEAHERETSQLRKDLLAMTHRYLKAQTRVEELEGNLSLLMKNEEDLGRVALNGGNGMGRGLRFKTGMPARDGARDMGMVDESRREMHEHQHKPSIEWKSDTQTLGNISVNSSDHLPGPIIRPTESVPLYLSSPSSSSSSPTHAHSLNPPPSPEHILKYINSLNSQTLEIARACIASTTFRGGARESSVGTEDVRAVSEVIGCVFLQMLRAGVHSQSSEVVELAIRATLAFHVDAAMSGGPDGGAMDDGVGRTRDSESMCEGEPTYSHYFQ
jgi:hypothetical protein